jgi:hypothetical protein
MPGYTTATQREFRPFWHGTGRIQLLPCENTVAPAKILFTKAKTLSLSYIKQEGLTGFGWVCERKEEEREFWLW